MPCDRSWPISIRKAVKKKAHKPLRTSWISPIMHLLYVWIIVQSCYRINLYNKLFAYFRCTWSRRTTRAKDQKQTIPSGKSLSSTSINYLTLAEALLTFSEVLCALIVWVTSPELCYCMKKQTKCSGSEFKLLDSVLGVKLHPYRW